jgi:hypothetical protein
MKLIPYLIAVGTVFGLLGIPIIVGEILFGAPGFIAGWCIGSILLFLSLDNIEYYLKKWRTT